MSADVSSGEASLASAGLRPYEDARLLIRLFQCALCSFVVREPVILPCGNSVCKQCLPAAHAREGISYPQNEERVAGFECPVSGCSVEHPLADCSLDVTLNKIVEVITAQLALAASSSSITLQLQQQAQSISSVKDNADTLHTLRVANGSRLVTTWAMASVGELRCESDLSYAIVPPAVETEVKEQDEVTATSIRDTVRTELECQVCYGLMVDPLTTNCGHTFCRRCVARTLDHSNLCPACRRRLSMRPGVPTEPSNKRLAAISKGLLFEELMERISVLQEEDQALQDDTDWMPLFPCTLAFPHMPTFLHVFEPRYRLMMRRAVESGSRKFGMPMYNNRREPQGELGRSQFMQYGTMLHIDSMQLFRDGRSLIETRGLYRFRILESSMLDGYTIARVQRVDDIPLAEEETAEANETSGPEPPSENFTVRLNHMSTQAILDYCQGIVAQARARSSSWLRERLIAAHGEPPDDPAVFPYWAASILPIQEYEKYKLLPTTSVRERLKITAHWIRAVEEASSAEREQHARLRDFLRRFASPVNSSPMMEEILRRHESGSTDTSTTPSETVTEPAAPLQAPDQDTTADLPPSREARANTEPPHPSESPRGPPAT